MSARERALNISWREAWPIWLTFTILFGFGALMVWVFIPAGQIPTKALFPGEDVALNIGELQPNLPRLFAYPLESGQTAEYFVERDAGNRITAAFASCRRCYRAGHYRQGGRIVCGRCNEPMVRAATGQTPAPGKDCTQIPIPFERSGDRLTIRANSVRDTFTRWYGPVISENDNSAKGSEK